MKTLLALITVAVLTALPAQAKTFKLPNEDFAIASIDMPDNWKPKEVDTGVEGQSPDDAVYMSVVAVGSEKGMSAEIDDVFEMLKSHNVTLDDSSKKKKNFKVGRFDPRGLLYRAKDGDGPAGVSFPFAPI